VSAFDFSVQNIASAQRQGKRYAQTDQIDQRRLPTGVKPDGTDDQTDREMG